MDEGDCEALAQAALDESGLCDRPDADPQVLAVAWGGLRLRPEPHCTPHLVDGTIVYRAGAPPDAIAWTCAHELAHAMLAWSGAVLEYAHEERCANRVASALILPRRAFRRDLRAAGGDLDTLARQWPLASPWVLARRVTEVHEYASAALWSACGRRRIRRAGATHEPARATVRWATRAGLVTLLMP